MSKKKKRRKNTRAEPQNRDIKSSFLLTGLVDDLACIAGYTPISENPEVVAGVRKIADLISSMTIHLMQNTDNGDVRIKNGLSAKVDINPNQYMTRKTFISNIVRSLLLDGNGNAVVIPITRDGYLEDLNPVPGTQVNFIANTTGYGYKIIIGGSEWMPGDLLHFVINPDKNEPWKGTGYKIPLKDVVGNLAQAANTKKGFMESKWQPSLIIKVDGLTDDMADSEGRQKILDQYISTSQAGQPWIIPAEQFEIEQIKPLSLTDIALPESVKLDKRTVASVLDVPPFVVGEGEFDPEEWNNFVNTRLRTICNAIEQELTKKLLFSSEMYFRFNLRSLYSYDIKTLADVGGEMFDRGLMTGNEARDWLGLTAREGLDELLILENYIPVSESGNQEKLTGGGDVNV